MYNTYIFLLNCIFIQKITILVVLLFKNFYSLELQTLCHVYYYSLVYTLEFYKYLI